MNCPYPPTFAPHLIRVWLGGAATALPLRAPSDKSDEADRRNASSSWHLMRISRSSTEQRTWDTSLISSRESPAMASRKDASTREMIASVLVHSVSPATGLGNLGGGWGVLRGLGVRGGTDSMDPSSSNGPTLPAPISSLHCAHGLPLATTSSAMVKAPHFLNSRIFSALLGPTHPKHCKSLAELEYRVMKGGEPPLAIVYKPVGW